MVSVTKSKYEQIQQELTQQIRQGSLAPESKLPTEQELALAYGVSRLTVRKAIGGLASAGLIQSIQGKGSFVAIREHPAVELKTIHLIAGSCHAATDEDSFTSSLLVHLGCETTLRGCSLSLSLLPRHLSFREFIRKNGLPVSFRNGVILTGIRFEEEDLQMLEDERIPYVFMPWKNEINRGPRVGSDSISGMRMCMETLLKHGHRNIGLVNCPVGYTDFDTNLDAYRSALLKAGATLAPGNIATASSYSEEEGRNAAEQLLKANPGITAVAIFGDRAASGFLRQLALHSIRVPEDLSVVVHDHYRWMESAFPFRLSGTRQNINGIAHALLDALESQRASGVTGNSFTRIRPDWIDGNSVAFTMLSVSNPSE